MFAPSLVAHSFVAHSFLGVLHSWLFIISSIFLIHVLLVWAWKRMVGGRDPLLDGCEELLIIPGGNGCMSA
jgi:hypothetical protein